MNFSWIFQTPSQGWWANYRWHITKSSEELGLKSDNWKKSFFRSGWQGKTLEIEGIDNAICRTALLRLMEVDSAEPVMIRMSKE